MPICAERGESRVDVRAPHDLADREPYLVARQECKQVIYEVTGLSDIIRGASNAQETATAQTIKKI